jgi:vesicular inhibitory amino acid transporter
MSAYASLATKISVGSQLLNVGSGSWAGKTSTFGTASSLVTTIVGASILGFPASFGRAGWYVAPFIVMICCWISIEVGYAMESSLQFIVRRLDKHEILGFTKPERYEHLCEAAYGRKGKAFASFIANTFMLALCGAFMILIGQCLEFVLNKVIWSPYRACVLATSVLFVPLALMNDMEFIARLSVVGTLASVVYAVSIGTAGLQAGLSNPDVEYRFFPEKSTDLGAVISVMFLGFTYQQVVPVLRSEMEHPTELPKAINGALALVTVIYSSAGALGYYGWGTTTQGNILRSMKTNPGTDQEERMTAGIFLALAVIANLLVTFPICMNCVSRAAEAATVQRYSAPIRMTLLLFAFCVGLFVPYFLEFLSLLGSVFGVLVGAIVPVAVYWSLLEHEAVQEGLRFRAVRHALVVIVALVAFIFGTMTAIQDLRQAMAKGNGGFWDYS